MKYSIKRFSSPYSKDYENKRSEEYIEDIDRARRGREIQALDEEADRVRWRSSLKKHESRRGNTAALLGGPGGLAGKWIGDKAAEVADEDGRTDDEIKQLSGVVGTATGLAAGLAVGHGLNKGVGVPAAERIKLAEKEKKGLEALKLDVNKYNKLNKSQKLHIANEIKARNQIIQASTRRAQVGKYAMPVLGIVGAVGAAKAVNDSVSERLARRKAIDSENRKKKERQDDWREFGENIKKGISNTGKSVKKAIKRITGGEEKK